MLQGTHVERLEVASRATLSLTPLNPNPNPSLTPPPTLTPHSTLTLSLLEVANRATLDFVLITKHNSPERGRTHSFRVSTCAAALPSYQPQHLAHPAASA